jgi:branched-chain amino acid transport system substrate-binding protein
MGKYLVDNGVKRLALVYSNYAAGAETAEAIKETYTGQVVAEVKPPFPNTSGDFAPFITQINGARPDAIYVFMSGQDAINFLKQAKNQLDKSIKVTGSGFFVEQDVLGAIGDAAPVGAATGLHWALTLDSKENQDFTASFKKEFSKTADVFAVQGYDTARVIVDALNAVKGKTDDKAAFMRAVAAVSFKSPRGDFKFDSNSNNVVNTVYVRQLVNDSKLGFTNKVISSVPNVVDPGK